MNYGAGPVFADWVSFRWARNELLGVAHRSILHICRYRGQSGIQDDEGLSPEQLYEFCRYPSFDSSLAFTVDTRPTGRCTVAAPADKNFHIQPPIVLKALSWRAGTRKYARKDFKGAGYCLGVHAKSMSIAWRILPRPLQRIQERNALFTEIMGEHPSQRAERMSRISITWLAVQRLDHAGR